MNWAQPASRMTLVQSGLGRRLVGEERSWPLGVGLRRGRAWSCPRCSELSSAITSHSPTRARAVLWWKSRRRLRIFRHSRARARRMRARFPEPGFARALRRCRSAITSAEAARNRGLADDLAVAGGQEPGHAHVHADLTPSSRERNRVGLGDDDDVPAAPLALELQRRHRPAYAAVLAHLHRPGSLKVRPRPATTGSRAPARAVTVDEPHLIEPAVRLEPGIAGLRPPGPGSGRRTP